jgi:hypothetical protein
VTRATSPQAPDVVAVIDAMDVARPGSRLAENRKVTFGNSTPLLGVEETHWGATLFLETICGPHHTIVNQRHVDGETIELNVTDDRNDGQQATIPCVTIFHSIGDGESDDYRSTSSRRLTTTGGRDRHRDRTRRGYRPWRCAAD